MGAPDFPVTASMQDQLREYYSRKIIAAIPSMIDDLDLQFGNVYELYIRMVNEGKINEELDALYFGANVDGITDSTAAFQRMADLGGKFKIPAGNYVINSVSLTKSIEFICDPGVTFTRKANTNTTQGSYWVAGPGMFEVNREGLRITFSDFTFDGNNANQPASEPTGFFLKTYPPATITGLNTTIHLNRGRFINGASNYLVLRGDDIQKRYETRVFIKDCRFFDTVYGRGKGDPTTPSALGFAPTYVLVMDYVRVYTDNFSAEWSKSTGTGQYAATALTGTFFGGTYANSGESSVYMHGTTFVKGLGRSIKSYDDANWNTNNAIGVIDMYGNVDTLFVEKVVGINSQFVTVRAKGSIKNYTVNDASLVNCQRGLQVGASSTGSCEAVVKVGNFSAIGGGMPQLEFVGTSTTDRLRHVSVDSAYLLGPFNNQESLATQGAVHVRNITKVDFNGISINTAILIGITCVDVKQVDIRGLAVDGTSGGVGFYVSGGDDINLSQFNIKNTSASGINLVTNPKKISIIGGQLTNTVDYGIFCNTTTSDLFVEGVEVDTVGGLNRAFYIGGGNGAFIGNKSNAASHVFTASGVRTRQHHNSWNPAITYGTAAPTVGTYSVGDIVYNTNAAASGTVGWVCTTAGTPGTWKTFGTIAA